MDYSENKTKEKMKIKLVGEVGLAHEGSLGIALSYCDALREAGADYAKFQMHDPNFESSRGETFRVQFSQQDATRFDYWMRTGFSIDAWQKLKSHCDDIGLGFLCTPFSVNSARLIRNLGVSEVKIGSGDLSNFELLGYVRDKFESVIISTGMSTWAEIEASVGFLNENEDLRVMVLQCTSEYPTMLSRTNVSLIPHMRERLNLPVGYSDHSGNISSCVAAAFFGAELIEAHVTLSKRAFGVDTSASLDIDEFERLASMLDDFEQLRSPIDKDKIADELVELRAKFGRSLGLVESLPKGHILREQDFCLRKPAGGLEWHSRRDLVGLALKRDVAFDELVQREDVATID